MQISRIRLSDWFHATAHAGDDPCRGPSRAIPNGPKIVRPENRRMPWDGTICRAELHWYEAHGVGRKELKLKRVLTNS